MREGEVIDLGMKCRAHSCVGMSEARYSRPTGPVQVTLPLSVEQVASVTGYCSRQRTLGRPSKNMPGHAIYDLTTSTETGDRRTIRSAFDPTKNSRTRSGLCEPMT